MFRLPAAPAAALAASAQPFSQNFVEELFSKTIWSTPEVAVSRLSYMHNFISLHWLNSFNLTNLSTVFGQLSCL
jgi:hypothetical protein